MKAEERARTWQNRTCTHQPKDDHPIPVAMCERCVRDDIQAAVLAEREACGKVADAEGCEEWCGCAKEIA